MAGRALWQVSVATSSEAEEAVAASLESLFSQPPVTQTDARTGSIKVSVYLSHRSDCPASKLADLKNGLQRTQACGLYLGPGKISLKKIPREDWAHSWKRHFKPLEISSALLIKPPWSKRKARRHQAVVILNPGLSFGTGQHPTTRFCLEQLAAWRQKEPGRGGTGLLGPPSCLDIGTGSGILAIAAVKLGYHPVEAFDFDPEAVRIARQNARQNRSKITFFHRDVTSGPKGRSRRFDVVCANLTWDLLLAAKGPILDNLKTPGVLIIAGLLRSQFAGIREQYEKDGLKFIRSKTEKEWKSGLFYKGL